MTNETCTQCGNEIKTMAFQNTGVCGELCRKRRDGELNPERALVNAPVTRAPGKIAHTGKVPNVQA